MRNFHFGIKVYYLKAASTGHRRVLFSINRCLLECAWTLRRNMQLTRALLASPLTGSLGNCSAPIPWGCGFVSHGALLDIPTEGTI